MITFQQARDRRRFLQAVYEAFTLDPFRPVPVSEIAEEISVSLAEASALVDSLVERGLLTRLAREEGEEEEPLLITGQGIASMRDASRRPPLVSRAHRPAALSVVR